MSSTISAIAFLFLELLSLVSLVGFWLFIRDRVKRKGYGWGWYVLPLVVLMIAVAVACALINIRIDDYFLKGIVDRLSILLGSIIAGGIVFIVIRFLPVRKDKLIKRLQRSSKEDKLPYLEGLFNLGEENLILELWTNFTTEERRRYFGYLLIPALKNGKTLSLLKRIYRKEFEPSLRAAFAETLYEREGDEFMPEIWELTQDSSPEIQLVVYRISLARLRGGKGTEDEQLWYVQGIAKLGHMAIPVLRDLFRQAKQGSKLRKALAAAIHEIDPKISLPE